MQTMFVSPGLDGLVLQYNQVALSSITILEESRLQSSIAGIKSARRTEEGQRCGRVNMTRGSCCQTAEKKLKLGESEDTIQKSKN